MNWSWVTFQFALSFILLHFAPSIFRLPHSNRTYFQCDVAICRGECVRPDCSSGERIAIAGGGGLIVGGGPLGSATNGDFVTEDPFTRPEDDAVTTSTSVFVAQPGSEAAGEPLGNSHATDTTETMAVIPTG